MEKWISRGPGAAPGNASWRQRTGAPGSREIHSSIRRGGQEHGPRREADQSTFERHQLQPGSLRHMPFRHSRRPAPLTVADQRYASSVRRVDQPPLPAGRAALRVELEKEIGRAFLDGAMPELPQGLVHVENRAERREQTRGNHRGGIAHASPGFSMPPCGSPYRALSEKRQPCQRRARSAGRGWAPPPGTIFSAGNGK